MESAGRDVMKCNVRTHMFQEDTELGVSMRFKGGLNDRQEDILQTFSKVRHKVPASENVTKTPENTTLPSLTLAVDPHYSKH